MLIGEKGAYTLVVREDTDAASPREDDNLGKMVCFHRRYNLGDEHDFANKDDFLRELYLDTVGNNEQGESRYNNLLERLDTPEHGGYGSRKYDRAVDAALLEAISEKHVILPLYLYDHSGITMNTSGFSCSWDSGQVGWIYAAKSDVLKEYGGKNLTAAKREKAESVLEGEVKDYDHYLLGDCYGFELLKNGETVDSCWGFIGDFEQVKQDIEGCLPGECRGMTESLIDTPEKVSVLDFLKEARAKLADLPVQARKPALEADAR